MHEVLVNRLGGLSLPRKSVVRLTDRPDMTLDVYRGRKTTIQQKQTGRVTALSLGSAAASALAKCLRFYFKGFYVMGKVLTGELSCPVIGLVGLAVFKSFYVKVFYVMGKALTGELSCPVIGLVG